ncbi:TonB-dependent receptor plug domain-containing protein [Polluticaenibacter yanchengensis]|uniref:TonB-dependent receptor n=1 Tax=Polluticaenibacter yanchengensis TaxID=3014562 RepID=A0ABT4UP78_9BACT|nr:TonB-dependent receptor [Chitinophagaceae bacterium LY-5]
MRLNILLGVILTTSLQPAFAQNESKKDTTSQLENVVVTGQLTPQQLSKSVYKVRTISQTQIKQRGATDIMGVLNNEIGIRFDTDYTLGETDVQLMGMSGQNVKILFDGIPIVDRGSTKQSLSQIDINQVERIEIVEGPMSVMYGTDALAGVINIITKKNIFNKTLQVSARVHEESMGSSYNLFNKSGIHNQNLSLNYQQNKFNITAGFTRNFMGGWQGIDTGRANEWKPKEQYIANAGIGYMTSKLNLWYKLNFLNENIITYGNDLNGSLKATDVEFITDRYNHQVQAELKGNKKFNATLSGSFQDYNRRTKTTDIDLRTGRKTLNITQAGGQDLSSFTMLFARGVVNYLASEKIKFQGGFEVKSDNTTGERISANDGIQDYALFISAEYLPTSGIQIRPGVRFIKNSVYDAPPAIPSINAKFNITKDLDFRASYAKGFRAPALRELFLSFFDANHSIAGNPNLKSEFSDSYNGSFTWQKSFSKDVRFSSSASGFYNRFKNLITMASAGDPNNPNLYTYANIGLSKSTGYSIENKLDLKKLTATLAFANIGRFNSLSESQTYKDLRTFNWSPELSSNISYTFTKTDTRLNLFYKYTAKTPSFQVVTDANTGQSSVIEVFQDNWHWMDFTVNQKLYKKLYVLAGVKNVFDIVRINNSAQASGGAHSSGGGAILKGTGRSYFVSLLFDWSYKTKK